MARDYLPPGGHEIERAETPPARVADDAARVEQSGADIERRRASYCLSKEAESAACRCCHNRDECIGVLAEARRHAEAESEGLAEQRAPTLRQ